MSAENFFIVNCFDRPAVRFICKRVGDKIYYIDPELSKDKYYREGFTLNEATSLKEFGFECEEFANGFRFFQARESEAKYLDGRTRKWQDVTEFVIQL